MFCEIVGGSGREERKGRHEEPPRTNPDPTAVRHRYGSWARDLDGFKLFHLITPIYTLQK